MMLMMKAGPPQDPEGVADLQEVTEVRVWVMYK